jgi:hypothetical protein
VREQRPDVVREQRPDVVREQRPDVVREQRPDVVREQRPDLIALLSRLVELLSRLWVERLDEARRQLEAGVQRAGRTAGLALAGALVLTVGLALVCVALVDALAPLVPSRPLRLTLVAAPLVLAGALALWRAGRRSNRLTAAAPDHRDDHQHQGQDQQHVNPRPDGVAADHSEEPQDQQQDRPHPQHRATSPAR